MPALVELSLVGDGPADNNYSLNREMQCVVQMQGRERDSDGQGPLGRHHGTGDTVEQEHLGLELYS